MFIKDATRHFLDFHRGGVNIFLHIIGFTGIFYSTYRKDWILFALSFLVLEAGHIYNHFKGIKKYDFRVHTILWRLIVFIIVVIAFYFLIDNI